MWRSLKKLATAFMILAFSVTIAVWGYLAYHNIKADMTRTYLQQSDIILNVSHQEYRDLIEQAERFLASLSQSEALMNDNRQPNRQELLQIVQYGHNVFSKNKAVKRRSSKRLLAIWCKGTIIASPSLAASCSQGLRSK